MNELKSIENLLFRVASEVASGAKDVAPLLSGNLQNDIKVDMDEDKLEASVGNSKLTPYAVFVHDGTGLYGKYHMRIVPKKGKALKTPFGYSKSVAGQKAQPYLKDALKTYVNGGGLDRALKSCQNNLKKEILEGMKENLKNSIK